MPLHEWANIEPGTFHNFHFSWIAVLLNRLNAGLLPQKYIAMAEQNMGRPQGDLLALSREDDDTEDDENELMKASDENVSLTTAGTLVKLEHFHSLYCA